MRGTLLFFTGILVGSFIQGATAQQAREPLMLNHVAVSVPDLDEGIRYYTKALGLKEAFTFRDNRGTPISYLQISRDTFLELQPTAAGQQPGLLHVGLEVADVETAGAEFRKNGLTVGNPSASARTNAVISQASGIHGLRFELLEFGPDSLQRRVMNEWKSAAAAPPAQQQPNTLTAAEAAEGWTLLFDGRTTTGWRGFKSPSFPSTGWVVEDGTLRHVKGQGGGDIITTEQYDNFDFQLEWKISPAGNSGIKYLIDENLTPGRSGLGFEMQVLDDERHPDAKAGKGGNRIAGALYDLIAPTNRVLHPVGQWNHARIVSRNGRVEHWMNGSKIVEFEIGSPAMKTLIAGSKYNVNPGFGEVRRGHILLQDHADDAWFRNIRIRRLTD